MEKRWSNAMVEHSADGTDLPDMSAPWLEQSVLLSLVSISDHLFDHSTYSAKVASRYNTWSADKGYQASLANVAEMQ
jgi:hypothetical protein